MCRFRREALHASRNDPEEVDDRVRAVFTSRDMAAERRRAGSAS
jgi:hypothetical protein